MFNGLQAKIQKNALLISAGVGIYGRAKESGESFTTILENSLFALFDSFSSIEQLKYKLWEAKHTPQMLTKLGLLLYGASEAGLIKKKPLALKIIKGGVLSSLITYGSGPSGNTINTFKTAQPISSYKY